MGNVDRVGVVYAFGNILNSVIARIDTVCTDTHITCFQPVIAKCHSIADFHAAVIDHGVAGGKTVCSQFICSCHFVSGAAIGVIYRLNDDIGIAAFNFVACRSSRIFKLSKVHSICVRSPFSNFGNLVAAVVQAGFGQLHRVRTIADFQAV